MPKATFKIPLGSISNGWMPIETLKDWNKPMLLAKGDAVVSWSGDGYMPFSDTPAAKMLNGQPTHWRPLPPPPETKE